MRRTVIGLFKSLHQAERALTDIETTGHANSHISLVVKKPPVGGMNDEYAEEITGNPSIGLLHDFDSFMVQADNIEVPEIGTVIAGGPLAGALIQGDKSLAQALSYYGVSGEKAARITNYVSDGYVLAVIETDNSKANEVANIFNDYGAHQVEKWSKSINKPLTPWN